MIELKDLTVKKYSPDELEVKWEFKPTQEDLTDYTIDIYRSQSPSIDIAEYDLLVSGLASDQYAYDDTTVSGLAHGTRKWYYKLLITNESNNETQFVPSGNYAYINDISPDYRWDFIRRRKKLALDRRSGRDFILLKRRT